MTDHDRTKQSSPLKRFIGICVVVGLAIAVTQLDRPHLLQNLLVWVQQSGAVGAIPFIALYILATVLLIPGLFLTISGGALFGVAFGTVYVLIGAAIGGTLAFLIGRYLARDWVSQRIEANPKLRAIDTAVAQEGLKFVLLVRLSPFFPFTLLNYTFGVTQVSLKDYLLGFIGMVPATMMYAYIGSLAGILATPNAAPPTTPQTASLQWLLRLVGLAITVMVTVYITRLAKKALDQTL